MRIIDDLRRSAERKQRAKRYISDAKRIVEEANERYQREYNKISSKAYDLEYTLRDHTEHKVKLAKKLAGDIKVTLTRFENFNIDKKTIQAPSFSSFGNLGSNLGNMPSLTSNFSGVMNPLSIITIFDFFISDEDYYEAKSKYEEAKNYKQQLIYKREELYLYRDKMNEILSFIRSERTELDTLFGKLDKMNGELRTSMEKQLFTASEAEYLKGIHGICELISKLLTTEFLGDRFSITSRYQTAFSEIKKINNALPSSPHISDDQTLSAIKDMLKSNIAY